jgi:hypothetical protein
MAHRRRSAGARGAQTTYYYCDYRQDYHQDECTFKKYVKGNVADGVVRNSLRKLFDTPGLLTDVVEVLKRRHQDGVLTGFRAQVMHWEKQVADAQRKLRALQDAALGIDGSLFTPAEIRARAVEERKRITESQAMADKSKQALSRHEQAKADIERLTAALRVAGSVELDDFALCRSLIEILQVGFIPDLDGSGNGEVILFYPSLQSADTRQISEIGKAELKILEQTQNGVGHKHNVSTM